MFVIVLTYRAPLGEIDAHMRAHVAFLKKHFTAGTFLVAGRQIPRTSGIILAVGESREQIESLMADHPFCKHGLADVRAIEFRASRRAPVMPNRIEPP